MKKFIIIFIIVIETISSAEKRNILDKNNNFAIFAAGDYKGKKLDFQIDSSGHMATTTNLYINYTNKPIILFIGNYEPTIWNIYKTPNTNIKEIVIGGYYKQILNGKFKSKIIHNNFFDDGAPYGWFYIKKNKFRAVNHVSMRLYNRYIDKLFSSDNKGNIFIGNTKNIKKWITFNQKPLEFYKSKTLSGILALEEAVKKGYLRKANRNDAKEWAKIANEHRKTKRFLFFFTIKEGKKIEPPMLLNAYVILKDGFKIPPGLLGADSATFFIPKGIKNIDLTNKGHSKIYDFNKF